MKKILCLIDALGMGGAERQIIGLALLLKQRGYRVTLLTYNDHNSYVELVQRYGLSSMTLQVKPSPLSKLMAVRHHIMEDGGYDCVITYKTGPNIIGCLLRLMGMRFQLIVSERNTTQHIGRMEKIRFRLYRKADYVVPNSQSQANFIVEHFPWLKQKTIVITNFTDTNHFAANYTKKGDMVKILTTARVAKQKNVLRYLDAVDLLRKRGVKNVHFDWYGDVQKGEETYSEEVFNKVKEMRLEDIISFHPATPKILEHYQQCDIFCLPSNYEGFPNVICEAMSCGKPILCSRVCDNPYIIREGENALMFDNTNIEEMADKIKAMCEKSQEELSRWGHRSREMAERLFSMDAFVEKYIKLIENS